jgi:hypothetical protein
VGGGIVDTTLEADARAHDNYKGDGGDWQEDELAGTEPEPSSHSEGNEETEAVVDIVKVEEELLDEVERMEDAAAAEKDEEKAEEEKYEEECWRWVE